MFHSTGSPKVSLACSFYLRLGLLVSLGSNWGKKKILICAMVKPVAFHWGWETSNLQLGILLMGPYKPLRNWVDEFIPYYMEMTWEFRLDSTRSHQKNYPSFWSPSFSGWWLQPLWKICSSKWVHLPQFSGWKKKLWNHHRVLVVKTRLVFSVKRLVELVGMAIFRRRSDLVRNDEMSNEKKPGWLGYIGDENLPSYIRIIVSHYKDPY